MTYRQWAKGACGLVLAAALALEGLLVLQAAAAGLAHGLDGFVSGRIADLLLQAGG